jgi:hypothetical protein
MAFPIPFNVTFDIYRNGNSPPAAPDVAGVSGSMTPRGSNIKPNNLYTHWVDMPLGTDIRSWSPGPDTIYVPDQNGTPFVVVQVVRIRAGAGNDYTRAYLNRQQPPQWGVNQPTNQL